jgi:hypothetical protein
VVRGPNGVPQIIRQDWTRWDGGPEPRSADFLPQEAMRALLELAECVKRLAASSEVKK